MASTALPSTRGGRRKKAEYPSVTMLNPENKTFSPPLKTRICENVKAWFDLELRIDEDANDEIARVRQDAFFLCRRAVSSGSNYAEQFEGLYSMMRGITVGLWLGSVYTAGWSVGRLAFLSCQTWTAGPISFLTCHMKAEGLALLLLALASLLSVLSYFFANTEHYKSINIASLIVFGLALFFIGSRNRSRKDLVAYTIYTNRGRTAVCGGKL